MGIMGGSAPVWSIDRRFYWRCTELASKSRHAARRDRGEEELSVLWDWARRHHFRHDRRGPPRDRTYKLSRTWAGVAIFATWNALSARLHYGAVSLLTNRLLVEWRGKVYRAADVAARLADGLATYIPEFTCG